MKLINSAARVGVAASAIALAGVLIGTPTAAAGPAGVENEQNYLDHLASVADVSSLSEGDAVTAGYLTCSIESMGGPAAVTGYSGVINNQTILQVANQHLCFGFPPQSAGSPAMNPGVGIVQDEIERGNERWGDNDQDDDGISDSGDDFDFDDGAY